MATLAISEKVLEMTATIAGPARLANFAQAYAGCASMRRTREIAPSEVNVPPARFVTREPTNASKISGVTVTNFVKKERSATWLRVSAVRSPWNVFLVKAPT